MTKNVIQKQNRIERKPGIYEKYIKRILDIVCAASALLCFCWVYVLIGILVRVKLGSPVIFKQQRPGKNEKIFTIYKFRTMTDQKDENGALLPDSVRLTKFGALLRKTSLDELPEVFNILSGDMSVVGPRPQLVLDMVFMNDEQRKRHTVMPGLTGLAQVRGRNNISWEKKFEIDLEYIENITLLNDIKIIALTVFKVLNHKDIVRDGTESDMNFGDWLLNNNEIDEEYYNSKMNVAEGILSGVK